MAFRFLNPAPVFLDVSGTALASGGTLTFYELGTTDPKGTWSDADLTIPNANPVPLDSAGRSNTSIWLDGAYSVVLKDGESVTVWTRDVQSEVPDGMAIPALEDGYFLSNDGTNLLWQPIVQVPDPTGSADNILSTDGVNLLWIPLELPEVPTPDIVVAAGSTRVGTSDSTLKSLTQSGSDSAASSGTLSTTKAVTYATAYNVAPKVFVQPTGGGVTPGGCLVRVSITSNSTTGFTVTFSTKTGGTSADNFGDSYITSSVPFDWLAVGTVVVA